MDILRVLTEEFHLRPSQTENVVRLIDDGNTIPFIARYRKEMTGSLDDQVLRELYERLCYLRSLSERREKIRAVIEEQGKLTEELAAAIDAALTLTELEDLYLPYRPKRRTRASVAREKGLEPLGDALYAQDPRTDPRSLAASFVDEEKGVSDVEEALAGARDILAERIAEDASVRRRLRVVCMANGALVAAGQKEELGVYEQYRTFREALSRVAGHRVLAINRGEREGFLRATVEFDREKALGIVKRDHVRAGASPCTAEVESAAEDAYDRLIFPAIERDIRGELTEKASVSAIKVFSVNLRQLLMQPPVKGKITIGLDPAYRTGCKVAVVDETGKVLDTAVIYPAPPHNRIAEAKETLRRLTERYGARVFAIGNGTASHETETFAAACIREWGNGLSYMVVSEAGASVYSASPLAAAEFPEYDVSLRSAVSIARRLQDPLSELVKIDPKAIGVGQYQHDMPQKELSAALDGVVESCVNTVGVDLNTASVPLLCRVAGISRTVAQNIVAYREENGAFRSRAELKKVPKLGAKAFEQCAGFLRVSESRRLFDRTAVHPESYAAAERLLSLCGHSEADLKSGGIRGLDARVDVLGRDKLAQTLDVGRPTLDDMVEELQKLGRDPRDELPPPLLRTDVMGIEDLHVGMELRGTVRNVIDFGAFVDIGVHQDGLVHISQITDRYIRHPSEVLKVGDVVTVWVLSVDAEKKRIGLTMKCPKSVEK